MEMTQQTPQRAKLISCLVTAHLTLSACAVLLPIFSAYLMSFIGLVLIMANPRATFQLFLSFKENKSLFSILKTILLASCVVLIVHFISAIGSAMQSPFSLGLGLELKKASHFFLKFGLLPFVIIMMVKKYIDQFPKQLELGLRFFCIFASLYAVYCLAQRYTGIDWVRGFAAVLPPNRFAHGVYRISGLMGHPLSLAYNLVIVIAFFLCLLREKLIPNSRPYLYLGLFSTSAILLASGSRLPILLAIFSLIFVFFEISKKRLLFLVGSLVLVFAALSLDPNFRGRSAALLQSDWSQKLDDRNYFWAAHFEMFKENPIFGVGLSGYEAAKAHYYGLINYHAKIYSAHNVYLQYLGDSGLVGFAGLIIFLFVLALVSWRLWKKTQQRFLAILCLITILSGFMQNTPRDSEYLFAFWICMVIFFSLKELGLKDEYSRPQQQLADYQSRAGEPHPSTT